jgi:hypothetical protein
VNSFEHYTHHHSVLDFYQKSVNQSNNAVAPHDDPYVFDAGQSEREKPANVHEFSLTLMVNN